MHDVAAIFASKVRRVFWLAFFNGNTGHVIASANDNEAAQQHISIL